MHIMRNNATKMTRQLQIMTTIRWNYVCIDVGAQNRTQICRKLGNANPCRTQHKLGNMYCTLEGCAGNIQLSACNARTAFQSAT